MSHSQTLISIVVPVFNTERYLNRCITSILNQPDASFELILVDDGSTDASGAICDAFAQSDPRVVCVHQENQGVSHARNIGIDLAQGRYLWFCDSDDYIEPNALSRISNILEQSPSAILAFAAAEEDEDGRPINLIAAPRPPESINEGPLQCGDALYPFCYVLEKAALGSMRFDESLELLEDRELFYRLRVQCLQDTAISSAVFYHYFSTRNNSASNHVSVKKNIDALRVRKAIFEHEDQLFRPHPSLDDYVNDVVGMQLALCDGTSEHTRLAQSIWNEYQPYANRPVMLSPKRAWLRRALMLNYRGGMRLIKALQYSAPFKKKSMTPQGTSAEMTSTMKRAYATVLNTDSYAPGALALASSLAKTGTPYPLVCVVSPAVSNNIITELERRCVNIVRSEDVSIPNLELYNGSNRWNHTFFKYRIFDLTEYDKIVFLDCDMIVRKNIDELFEKAPHSAVPDSFQFTFTNGPLKGFNSGLMVVTPNEETTKTLINMTLPIVMERANTQWGTGDQDVLNRFLASWSEEEELHLPETYNASAGMLTENFKNENTPCAAYEDIAVLHFVGGEKPWHKEARIRAYKNLLKGKMREYRAYRDWCSLGRDSSNPPVHLNEG